MYAKQVGLIALMVLGSVSLWVANPLLWFWLTSHLQSQAGQAQMGPYALLLIGVIFTAVVLAKGLATLNRRYGRLIGAEPTVRIIVPWRRSLRDARHGGLRTDQAAIAAVVLAKGLATLNRRYGRLIGAEPTVRIIVPWRRSLRDARHGGREDPGRVPVSILDVVMVLSVLAAVIAFAIWYVVTDPTPPNVGGPGPSKD